MFEWNRVKKSCKCILLLILLQGIFILGISLLSLLRGNNITLRSIAELQANYSVKDLIQAFKDDRYENYNTSTKAFDPSETNAGHNDTIPSYKFRHYDVRLPPEYVMKADHRKYFIELGKNKPCFTTGTNIEGTRKSNDSNCICNPYYYGADCGIPEAAWFGMYEQIYPFTKLKQRSVPRRIINGLPVNHEFAMFEARMHELYDVVNVFLIAESNYTAHGDPKDLLFLKKFQEGYMAKFQEKFVYVRLDYFSKRAKSDGWFADSYIRSFMGKRGLPLLKGLRDDDLFVLSDADELPTREIITFLKVYNGYPEPIGFAMRWNIFNFHWLSGDNVFMPFEKLTTVYAAATIGFVQKVLGNDVFNIRKVNSWEENDVARRLSNYTKDHWVKEWVAGQQGHYAGWHCSWCFSPENIVRKMDSAQAQDKPRWGDYPEKKRPSYILSLIKEGRWFNDIDRFLEVNNLRDRFYAPPFFLANPENYRSILYPPSHPLNKGKPWRPP